jgi:DNA-binding CsgD family transcriptional regulator
MLTFRSEGFTLRQRQVVHLIARGHSNAEIADRLGISPRTVKAHADALRVKLRVARRRQIPAAFRETTGEDPHHVDVVERGAADGRPADSRA